MSFRFRLFENAATYAEYVRPFLLSSEAGNNVLLRILPQLVAGDHEYEYPLLLGAVESGDGVVGCAWRTPPYKLGITYIPEEALKSVVDGVGTVYPMLDTVVGPEDTARQFGRAWSKKHDLSLRTGMRRGIYALASVIEPPQSVPGSMVVADDSYLPLIVEWGRGFRRDSMAVGADPDILGRRRVASRRMYLWVDEVPRSMAARVAETDNGVRVGYVYTPPEQRGRGYASALVATVSQAILDEGWPFCLLQADLANPTSTGIYERLGYQKVAEVVDILFEQKGD